MLIYCKGVDMELFYLHSLVRHEGKHFEMEAPYRSLSYIERVLLHSHAIINTTSRAILHSIQQKKHGPHKNTCTGM
jgi:hypothetical protein